LRKTTLVSIILAVALVTPTLAADKAKKLTESELLLSGVRVAADPSALPRKLHVPKAWQDRFRNLSEKTSQSEFEYSSCLTVDIETGYSNRTKLLSGYAILMEQYRKGEITALEYSSRTGEIRENISKMNLADARINWSVGSVQSGDKTSADLEVDLQKCSGAVVADVHSHPSVSIAAHSSQDFWHTVATDRLKATFVVEGNDVCGLLKTGMPFFDPYGDTEEVMREAKKVYASSATAASLHAARNNQVRDRQWDLKSRTFIASAAERTGMGYYCGKIGKSLTKITPATIDVDDPLFLVAAKGLVIALVHGKELPAVDFEFSPSDDGGLEKYIGETNLFGILSSADLEEAENAMEKYEAVASAVSRVSSYLGTFAQIPMLGAEEIDFVQSDCNIENGTPHCYVLKKFGSVFASEGRSYIAEYWASDKRGEVVTEVDGAFRINRHGPDGPPFSAPCRYVDERCLVDDKLEKAGGVQ
jgi:hypothetical protein